MARVGRAPLIATRTKTHMDAQALGVGCNVMVAYAGLGRHWVNSQDRKLSVNCVPLSRNHGSNLGAGCSCR